MRPIQSLLLPLAVALFISGGCADKSHIDTAVITDLDQAIGTTIAQMQVPAAEIPSRRAITDQAGLLAMQCDDEAIARIRSGAMSERDIRAEAAGATAWLGHQRTPRRPPAMLTFLLGRENPDDKQLLLLYALARQAKRESGYSPEAAAGESRQGD